MLALLAALLFTTPGEGGTVAILQGTIETKADADPDFKPLKAGDPFDVVAQVRTGAMPHTSALSPRRRT